MTVTEPIRGRTIITLGDQLRLSYRQVRRTLLLFGGMVLLGGVALLRPDLFGLSPKLALIFLLIMGVSLAVGPLLIGLSFRRLAPGQKDVTFELSPSSLVVRDSLGAVIETPWELVQEVEDGGPAYIVRFRPMGLRWIPKRAFTAADLERIEGLLGDLAAARTTPAK